MKLYLEKVNKLKSSLRVRENEKIINSEEAKIRSQGKNYYDDKVITQKQKDALKNVILNCVSEGGYFLYIDEILN